MVSTFYTIYILLSSAKWYYIDAVKVLALANIILHNLRHFITFLYGKCKKENYNKNKGIEQNLYKAKLIPKICRPLWEIT